MAATTPPSFTWIDGNTGRRLRNYRPHPAQKDLLMNRDQAKAQYHATSQERDTTERERCAQEHKQIFINMDEQQELRYRELSTRIFEKLVTDYIHGHSQLKREHRDQLNRMSDSALLAARIHLQNTGVLPRPEETKP